MDDDTPCPSGLKAHAGTPMGEVPARYLDWLHGQEWLLIRYPEVYSYIEENRDAIDKELGEQY